MPHIENKWTIGNVVAVIGIMMNMVVLGGGGVWYASQQDARVSSVEGNLERIEVDFTKAMTSANETARDNAVRIRSVELSYGRMDERMISVQTVVNSIDRRLEAIYQNQRRDNP